MWHLTLILVLPYVGLNMPVHSSEKPRVLLLLPTRTYRATDFLDAALKLNVEVVVASEEPATTSNLSPRDSLALDFQNPTTATETITEFAEMHPITAIVGVDDDTTILATTASAALGLPHNPISSAKLHAISTFYDILLKKTECLYQHTDVFLSTTMLLKLALKLIIRVLLNHCLYQQAVV